MLWLKAVTEIKWIFVLIRMVPRVYILVPFLRAGIFCVFRDLNNYLKAEEGDLNAERSRVGCSP